MAKRKVKRWPTVWVLVDYDGWVWAHSTVASTRSECIKKVNKRFPHAPVGKGDRIIQVRLVPVRPKRRKSK